MPRVCLAMMCPHSRSENDTIAGREYRCGSVRANPLPGRPKDRKEDDPGLDCRLAAGVRATGAVVGPVRTMFFPQSMLNSVHYETRRKKGWSRDGGPAPGPPRAEIPSAREVGTADGRTDPCICEIEHVPLWIPGDDAHDAVRCFSLRRQTGARGRW